MGIFTSPTERRDAFPYPAIPPNSQAGTTSLRSVNLSRADSAMQKIAIFASVNLLASITAMLPFNVYRGLGGQKAAVTLPKFLTDVGGEGHGTSDFLWQVVYCWGLRGNVVGQVTERQGNGLPATIMLHHPDDVSVVPDPEQPLRVKWMVRGKQIPTQDVWHRRVYPTPGRTLGLSPIAMHAVTIQQGLYAQNFGAQWFLDGAHPSAILTNKNAAVKDIDQGTARAVKDRFLAAIRGTREPAVLGNGWEYQQIQIAAGESQFLETQKYTAAECARIYGPGMPEILGYETGGSMTYANIEQRSVDLLTYTLDPWLTRVERLLSELLPQPQYVRFDRKALLRTDALTRFQKHAIALKNALQPINEIRTLEEDLEAVPWGDSPYMPALGPAAAAAAVNNDGIDPSEPATPAPQGGQQT